MKRPLVLAPPSAQGNPCLKSSGEYSDAFVSGWMRLRGARLRHALARGFVLSDHADRPGPKAAIDATGAQRVIVTHGEPADGFEADFGVKEGADEYAVLTVGTTMN